MTDQPLRHDRTPRLRSFLRRHWGLLLLLAILLPLRLMRARLESSIWIDETYSFFLAEKPVARILDFLTVDPNPPGYFLALKAWLKAVRMVGGEPGVFAARLLSCLGWVLLAVSAWFGGERLLGRRGGALLAISVAGSGYAAIFAKDARGYSVASVSLFVCFISLSLLYRKQEDGSRSILLWAIYAAAAGIALWTHALSGLVILFLFVFWLASLNRARRREPGYLAGGVIAHLAILFLFLPWVIHLASQVKSLNQSAPSWMTPATLRNWLSVFWYWYPFGPAATPEAPPSRIWIPLGILSLLPIAVAIVALLRGQTRERDRSFTFALSGISLTVLFVSSLWFLQRLNLAPVFHAPRYPGLTASLWAAGLVGISVFAVRRLGWKESAAWILMAPWLLSAALGEIALQASERASGTGALPAEALALLPPRGEVLYVFPTSLVPFHREFLSPFRVKPVSALPCDMERGARDYGVLDLNFWHLLDSADDLVARTALHSGALGRETSVAFPASEKDYTLYRLTKDDTTKAEALCRAGLLPEGRAIPASALSVALPEDQLYGDGWSYPEVSDSLELRRWATSPEALVRFDRKVPPGEYLLHYRGYRAAKPAATARVGFRVEGESEPHFFREGEGDFMVTLPLHLPRERKPTLYVSHPTWSAGDNRRLSSLLWYAWIEPK